jgi:hypothetical protein
MPFTPDQLNPAERALWDAFPIGGPVDLRGAPDRTVRAEVIAALLRGSRTTASGERAGLTLLGADVTGRLDLTFAEVTVPLTLEECVFDTELDLTNATMRSVRIQASELPGLVGRLMRVGADLDLRRSVVRGRLSLVRATITGELRLTGAHLINPGAWALFAGGMVVESAFFGSVPTQGTAPLTVDGGIRMAGARILGGLFFDGVQLRNPGGVCLNGDNMTVAGRMMCGDGFAAEGRIALPHARIEGPLSFAGATLADPDVALALNNAVIDDLDLRTAVPVTGLVDLRHARCGVLRDAADSWPAAVALDGFSYDTIDAARPALTVARRLTWLRRDPEGFRPQPYEQLAALYRRLGSDADARRVQLEKLRRNRRELRWPTRILGHLLDSTVGYGYRPWRAALWLVLMLGLGTAVFTAWPPVSTGTPRHFDAVVYTLDLLVPISTFGLRDTFAPVGATRWLAYTLTVAGWLLATALIAGVTRTLRRD